MANLKEIIDELSLTRHLENTPLGIIGFDNSDRILYMSKRAGEIFGYEAFEVIKQTLFSLDIIHPEEAAAFIEFQEQIFNGIVQDHRVFLNQTKLGKPIFCEWYYSVLKDASGRIINMLAMVQDVTARKLAEKSLEKSNEQLAMIYNSTIDPMWLVAVEGESRYRFENINQSFTPVTGLERNQVIGYLIEEVLPLSSHALVIEKYNEAVRTGKVIDYVEIAVHPAGKKTGEIRVIPVKNSEGIVTRIVGIAHDITDKVNLQEKLDKEREEFSRRITSAAIRGQEIERSIVSRELHDNVNQVLTTVKLYVELCAAGAVNQTEMLTRSSELLNDSINEIRNLSKRLSAPSLGDVGIIDTIKGLVETVEATREFNIVFDSENICCSVMENELHLALYRIAQEQLTNIIKHAKAKNVFIRLEGSENHVSLIIIDDGQGFDERKMKQGIGITNMASRTHILNGSFKMESEEEKGCSLWVSFPIEIIGGKCYSKTN